MPLHLAIELAYQQIPFQNFDHRSLDQFHALKSWGAEIKKIAEQDKHTIMVCLARLSNEKNGDSRRRSAEQIPYLEFLLHFINPRKLKMKEREKARKLRANS
jgi:hypothetical protein